MIPLGPHSTAIAIDADGHAPTAALTPAADARNDDNDDVDGDELDKKQRHTTSRSVAALCASLFTTATARGNNSRKPSHCRHGVRKRWATRGLLALLAGGALLYQLYDGVVEELSFETCSPHTIDPNATAVPHGASPDSADFYTMVRQLGRLQAPAFRGRHRRLCDAEAGRKHEWEYCLPISGRMDIPYCALPDRVDVLSKHTSATLCYGSVLHMMLVDVYEVFKERGAKPALLYGTMLGAFRNGSTIPFTEDADVGYQPAKAAIQELRDALWTRGYHMFHYGIGRICIAPTHPLASYLYDSRKGIATEYSVPYVDLYTMNPVEGKQWRVQMTEKKRFIPQTKFEPYSQVRMNGVEYDTLADPVDFLVHEYGTDYMVPKPTLNWFWTIVSYVWS